jgi:hypothetical protein
MTFLNPHVLAVCAELPRGGGYRWPTSDASGGCLRDVVYRGTTILRAGAGTYCCGLVFEVWWRALERAGASLRLTVPELRRLQQRWFVATGTRKGPVDALVPVGLGVEVPLGDARPGDFAQLWRRNGSGHSVVVLGVEGGKLRYLSTQASTDGIGERVEAPAEVFVARAILPEGP